MNEGQFKKAVSVADAVVNHQVGFGVPPYSEEYGEGVLWADAELQRLRAALARAEKAECERDAAVLNAYEITQAKEKAEHALRSVAGAVGEFADADGKNIAEKIEFLRKDWEERIAKAEGALCRAREFISNAEFAQPGESIRALLVISEHAPCPHAEELKIARETVAGQEAEIREGDFWKERARESFANGTCPCCFCTDEGPHDKGCAWAEHGGEAKRLREAVEWACNSEESKLHQWQRDELRRRAGVTPTTSG